MKDGLYKVHFKTPLGEGFGVITLIEGKARGGDAGMYYTGSYSVNNGQVRAEIDIARHSPAVAGASVFGVDDAHIVLVGMSDENSATTTGQALEAPGIQFQAKLVRIAD